MYMYTCKQSLHESSCCKAEERHGLWSCVVDTTLVDYMNLCAFVCVFMHCPAARGSETHTNLHQSFLHTSPSHFDRWKVQLVQSVFIVWSLFLWALSFLIWCLDVVLHYRGFGEIDRRVTPSTFTEGKNVVAYLQLLFKEIFLFDVHISVLCLLQLCTVKRSLFKMKFSRMLIYSHCNDV